MSYSSKEFQIDISMLNLQATESVSELQLAAELGKMLLERNEHLETTLRVYQDKIYDQEEEIKNLSKQTRALHEVNDSRLKIYEQLEVNIEELERSNHKLAIQTSTEREKSWCLKDNIHKLENKCLDLEDTIETLNKQLLICQQQSILIEKEVEYKHSNETYIVSYDCTPKLIENKPAEKTKELTEQITTLLAELETTQQQLKTDKLKILKLEEELAQMVKKNKDLEDQIITINEQDSFKSVDLQYLDEIGASRSIPEGMTLFDEIEEDESLLEIIGHNSECALFYGGINNEALTSTPPKPKANLYKELIEKYEALLELHNNRREDFVKTPDSGVKIASPTSFSEISTSSSDASLSNIGTQTKEHTNLQFGKHELVLYDPTNKIRKCIHNQQNYKKLFLALLEEIEKGVCQESYECCSAIDSSVETTANYNRDSSLIAKPKLAAEQISIDVEKNKEIITSTSADANLINSAKDDILNEPVLVPYIRKPIEETCVQKKKVSKKKSKCNENASKPLLVGYSNVSYLNKSDNLDAKNEISINFYYPEYKKSSAGKNLKKLQHLDSRYAAVLKKSDR